MINWSHSRDSRARPGTSFSANVNFSSTRFNQTMLNNPFQISQNQLNSSISYSKDWSSARRTLLWTANLTWISLVLMFATVFIGLSLSGGEFGPGVHGRMAQPAHADDRSRIFEHMRMRGQDVLHQGEGLIEIRLVGHLDGEMQLPDGPEIVENFADDLPVGHDHPRMVRMHQGRRKDVDHHHIPVYVQQGDVLPHLVGLGENNGEPGHDVAQDSLQRQADAESCHPDPREQRRNLNPQLAQAAMAVKSKITICTALTRSIYTVRRYPSALVAYLRGHGAGKEPFGSNWPMIRPGKALEGLDELALEPQARAAFLAGNAARVFGL